MLVDLHLDPDLGEVGLDHLRRRQALGLVEDVEGAAEAVRMSGLGEQRPGLLDIGNGVAQELLAMPDQARGDNPVRPLGDAEIGRLEHGVDVDRPLHRLAHLGIVERRASVFMPSQT